jgi:hypothetical protein
MSYENTSCPCGEKKLTDTMLCAACETAVGGSYDRKAWTINATASNSAANPRCAS